jgi:hypothetical protein
MNQDIADHFASIVTAAFPRHADMAPTEEDGDLCLFFDWHLRTDHTRPNKRSKVILVRVTRDAISDYANRDDEQRRQADALLKGFLRAKFAALNPEPIAPAHIVSTPEEWLVETRMINL